MGSLGRYLFISVVGVLLLAGPASANPIAEVARPQLSYQAAFLIVVTLLEAGVLYAVLRPKRVVAETLAANLISYVAGFGAFFIWAALVNPLPEASTAVTSVARFRSQFLSLASAEHDRSGLAIFLLLCFTTSVVTEGAYLRWRWRDQPWRKLVVGVGAANAVSYALFFPILVATDAAGYFITVAVGLAVLEGVALHYALRPPHLWPHVAAANVLALPVVASLFLFTEQKSYLLPVGAGYLVKTLYVAMQWGSLGRARVVFRTVATMAASAALVIAVVLPTVNPYEVDWAVRKLLRRRGPIPAARAKEMARWTERQRSELTWDEAVLPKRLREGPRAPATRGQEQSNAAAAPRLTAAEESAATQ